MCLWEEQQTDSPQQGFHREDESFAWCVAGPQAETWRLWASVLITLNKSVTAQLPTSFQRDPAVTQAIFGSPFPILPLEIPTGKVFYGEEAMTNWIRISSSQRVKGAWRGDCKLSGGGQKQRDWKAGFHGKNLGLASRSAAVSSLEMTWHCRKS